MRILASVLIVAVTAASAFPRAWQNPQNPGPDEETVVVGTTEVLMDAVVKDKKGAVVKDLKASDFEVMEDGVRQEIRSFRLVTRDRGAEDRERAAAVGSVSAEAAPAQPTVTRRPAPPASARPLGAVALVFDRLSPEARVRARDAALSYVGAETRPDDFVGVFGIDLSLRAVQPFTSDAQLVRQAIERYASGGAATHGQTAEQLGSTAQQLASNPNQTGRAARGWRAWGRRRAATRATWARPRPTSSSPR